jgi:hypothetical protein
VQKNTRSKGPMAALRVLRESPLGSESHPQNLPGVFQSDLGVNSTKAYAFPPDIPSGYPGLAESKPLG